MRSLSIPVLDSNSLPSGAVVAIIIFAVTFIITVTITTIIVTYICCVKKKRKGTFNLNNQSPQQRIYEEVGPPNQTVNNDVELQLNPAYGTSTSYIVNMNHTNPTYELCN